ncbi:hypothetical protein V5799_022157 [Amblyomma americanum]|uniref:Uncharacterized protein n=1 Tax=Amblyomma americanum TaxID=6943 RepID=A0AAQ4FNC4_AMBAM
MLKINSRKCNSLVNVAVLAATTCVFHTRVVVVTIGAESNRTAVAQVQDLQKISAVVRKTIVNSRRRSDLLSERLSFI